MANEFIIKNGFHSKGNSQVTGSLNVSSTLTVNGSAVGAAFPFTGDAQITGSLIISGSTPLTIQGGTENADTVLLVEEVGGVDLLTVKGDGEVVINNANNGLTGKLSFGNGISDGFIYMQDQSTGPSSKYSIPQRTSNNDSSLQFWVGNTAGGPKLFPHKDTSQGLADRSVIEIDLYNSGNNSRGLDFIVGGAAVTTTYQPKLWRFFSWDGVNDPDSGNIERLSIGNSPLTTGGDAEITISASRVGIGAPSPSASLEINPPSGSFPSLIVSGSTQITGSLDVSGSITTFDINMSTWTLGADGGNNYYYFTGPGDLAGTEQNPDIHLTRGQKYRFYNPMDAHPFQIQDTGGSAFSTGVTNNGVQLGFLSFDVPMDGPTHLKYQCTAHAAMVGNIYIADARVASGSFSGSFQGDGSSLTGVGGDAFPFTGTAGITGSISITGSAQEIVFKGATSTNYPKIDFPDSINIGNGTTMYTGSSGDVVIGQNADTNYAGTYYSTKQRVAIGKNADVSGGGSIAIGHGASAASTDGVAIGYNASSGGLNSVAIGSAASGASNGVVIGANSSVAGQHSIAIKGTQTSGTGYGVTIGGTVGATGVAVGYGSSAGSNSTGIGYNADATGTGAVAIGPSIISSGLYAISISTRQYGGSQFTNPSGSSFAIYHNNSTPTFFLHKDDISYYNSSGKFGFNTLTPTATLTVSGSFTTTGSAIISSSNSDIALSVQGSGSTVFNIIGSEGTLFAIEDDLDGTLFTVNDRSGIPMFEVSASGRIVAEEGESIIRSQRPIVTHTSDFSITSSLDYAGKYHIVGGSITCSINTGSLVPTGAEFEFFQTSSAGNFLFITGSPHVDIIVKNDNMNLAGQGSGASLKYIGGSTFHLVGDLT